jgi:hypothetical protein
VSTVEQVERESFAFGSDAMIARLLELIATHENTHGGIALYGQADMLTVETARHAVKASDTASDDMRAQLCRAFTRPGSFWLMHEQSAVLVESLVDYATGDSPCEDYDGAHHGHTVTGTCDCAMRSHARMWVCEVAATNGIDMADETAEVWA